MVLASEADRAACRDGNRVSLPPKIADHFVQVADFQNLFAKVSVDLTCLSAVSCGGAQVPKEQIGCGVHGRTSLVAIEFKKARISSTRQAVHLSESLTGAGYRDVLTPCHQVDFETGIVDQRGIMTPFS